MKLVYLVHDLQDPAVHRRLRMLHRGGVDVTLLGFARGDAPIGTVEGQTPICLGRTQDARMAQRTVAVIHAGRHLAEHRRLFADADVIMARQLETLVLARLAQRRFAPAARLVFECLDIHRLMTADNVVGRGLRALEARLLRHCDLLAVSSPHFVSAYFVPTHGRLPPVCLLENKVLEGEIATTTPLPRPPGPPWRIGWFGVIRCRRSLTLLADTLRRFPDRLEVVIRGRPARNVLPDFDAVVAATPGMTFLGPYDRERDLARIHADVHYVWAIDYYEAGGNSDWLLPNRLYEGGACGAVPIARSVVATGAWLQHRQAGICLDEPLDRSLPAFVESLDAERDATAHAALQRIPRHNFVCDTNACRDLAAALAGVAA